MKFVQKDPYYCASQNPHGYTIAKVFCASQVKFVPSKDKSTLSVEMNFRAALKCCIDEEKKIGNVLSLDTVDLTEVSRHFRSSTSPMDKALFE